MADSNDQELARREKLALLQKAHLDPYPARIGPVETILSTRANFSLLAEHSTVVSIAGRIRALRLQGGSMFIDIDDGTGKLQCFLSTDQMGNAYDQLVDTIDLGDFLKVTGTAFTTKRGEQTIKANAAIIISKTLRPMPDKRHGLADTELRYRYRELDLIANDEARKVLETRSRIVNSLRSLLVAQGFLEVETPILQSIPGGATARPFITHHNALDVDLYLRIAPELYLKRLIVGGFRRVFEIARCFRNEGIDYSHNPEFTQIELYAAYMDYTELMALTEKILKDAITEVLGTLEVPSDKGTIRFGGVNGLYPRTTFRAAIKEYAHLDIEAFSDEKKLFKKLRSMDVDVTEKDHRGKMLDEVFKTFVRPKITNPVFIIDHPVELSPLAKKKSDDPRYVERFQLIVGGSELCNAFSELNDPIDQRQRFLEQEQLRTAGDDEAQRVDEEFIQALEHGMPPTAGLGIGIDRLTMILTNNHSIKEVIAFPTLKPRQ